MPVPNRSTNAQKSDLFAPYVTVDGIIMKPNYISKSDFIFCVGRQGFPIAECVGKRRDLHSGALRPAAEKILLVNVGDSSIEEPKICPAIPIAGLRDCGPRKNL